MARERLGRVGVPCMNVFTENCQCQCAESDKSVSTRSMCNDVAGANLNRSGEAHYLEGVGR